MERTMRIRILSLLPALFLTLVGIGLAPQSGAQERTRIAQDSLVDVAELDQVEGVGRTRARQLRHYFDRLLESNRSWVLEEG